MTIYKPGDRVVVRRIDEPNELAEGVVVGTDPTLSDWIAVQLDGEASEVWFLYEEVAAL